MTFVHPSTSLGCQDSQIECGAHPLQPRALALMFFLTCPVLTALIPPVRVLSVFQEGSRRHTRFLTIFLLFQGKKVDGAANAYAINVSQKRKYRFVSQHAGRLTVLWQLHRIATLF